MAIDKRISELPVANIVNNNSLVPCHNVDTGNTNALSIAKLIASVSPNIAYCTSIEDFVEFTDDEPNDNKLRRLRGGIKYIIDFKANTDYKIGSPLNLGQAQISFVARDLIWTYTGDDACFKFSWDDAGTINIEGLSIFEAPNGMGVFCDSSGANGLLNFQLIGVTRFDNCKKLGFFNAPFAGILVELRGSLYNFYQGFEIKRCFYFEIKCVISNMFDAIKVPLNSTVGFEVGNEVQSSSGGLGTIKFVEDDHIIVSPIINNNFINGDTVTDNATTASTTMNGDRKNNTLFDASNASVYQELNTQLINLISVIPQNATLFDINKNAVGVGTIENVRSTLEGSGLVFLGKFFGDNSLNERSPTIRVRNCFFVGISDSTLSAQNSLPNSILIPNPGQGVLAPIDGIWQGGAIEERITFQDLCTFDNATNTINTTFTHNLQNGDEVSFFAYDGNVPANNGVLPAEIINYRTADRIYYVINATTTSFQVSETLNGGVLNFTTNGTGILYYLHQTGNIFGGRWMFVCRENRKIDDDTDISVVNADGTEVAIFGALQKFDINGTIILSDLGSDAFGDNAKPATSRVHHISEFSRFQGATHYVANNTNNGDNLSVVKIKRVVSANN